MRRTQPVHPHRSIVVTTGAQLLAGRPLRHRGTTTLRGTAEQHLDV